MTTFITPSNDSQKQTVFVCMYTHKGTHTCVTPWTVVCQAPLSMEFSRQEYWSGLSFPISGDLPDPGIKPESLASSALAGGFFTTASTWEAIHIHTNIYIHIHTHTHIPILEHTLGREYK